MSEWKWCQNCDHHINDHHAYTECMVEGCECREGYFDLSDLL